ncbi:MAG: 4-(cytidine 5'-diphospho)-2-C-methyl-D-erythritol kinase [Acidimicrobiales bacterium]|nr:MAG: 4-(cytidine 5'-diphospho)-2-C-methyl-D-erythritol kinase [Acidimicrobiales bacterium]
MGAADATPVSLRAHAKLTRTLHITGVRPDGYHLIDAEMVSLDLHDLLVIDPAHTGLTATGPFSSGIPLDDSNLVAKALRLAGRSAHVTIDKRIPHGGGLGGGSTDAATALRWAGFGTARDDLDAASRLGADIPFCLVGGRARVTGIGEIVEPLPHLDITVTLVIPPLTISTPAAYRAWDDLGAPTGTGPNDLEAAALAVEPRLARWRDLIGERTGTAPTLAGSGATWFTEGEHGNALAELVDEGATVVVARTVPMDVATERS